MDLNTSPNLIKFLESNQKSILKNIRKAKSSWIYNLGKSSKVGAIELIKHLNIKD